MVKYGLTNVHYALISESNGVVTYSKPVRLFGAVNISVEPKGDTAEFYADDNLYFGQSANQGYSGELEIALVPDEFKVDVMGCTIDANGVLIENKDDNFNDIALLFEFSGDKNKTRHVFYRVTPSRSKIESSTNTSSKEPKTDTLSIVASPAIDTGDIRAKVAEGDSAYTGWYNAVYLKNSTPPEMPPVEAMAISIKDKEEN